MYTKYKQIQTSVFQQEAVKNKRETREDVGVELYGVQQELARHQMMLEKYHDDFSNIRQARHLTEQELLDVREMYKSNQKSVNEEKRKGMWQWIQCAD